MITKFSKGLVALTAIVAAAALTLTGPAKANDLAAGFYGASSGLPVGVSWNVTTGASTSPANLSGGTGTAMFGVSQSGIKFSGVADGGADGAGIFQGCIWDGNNGSTPTALADSGTAQGFSGNDTPWSVNDSGVAVGQGVGQISGYDQGFFAQIEWTNPSTIVDVNGVNDPAGNPMNSSSYYGGPVYIEGFDFTGVGLSAAGINNNGDMSGGTSFQNFGSFFFQAVVIKGGKAYVLPYTDSADPAATSWNISGTGATCGYNFENSLSAAYGYTGTATTSGYSFGANGGTGLLANYGQGPNVNFQWFIDTNDSGNGTGQAVGFDIDSTGSFNHAVYDKNDTTAQEIADDRGGNTTFLIGVANDGASAGFETISADGEAFFHGWGTKAGTPGATTDYVEPSGAQGSKFFEIASGGNAGPGVKTLTGAFKGGKYKAVVVKHGKPSKISVILTSAAGGSGQVVTVTSSNHAALGDFTITVPAGQTTVNNFKTLKAGKTTKGQSITLTACANGGCQSVTVTIK